MHDKQTVREELSNLPLNINSDAVGFGSNHPSSYRCKAQELTKIIGTRDGWLVFSWRAEVFFNRSTISGGGERYNLKFYGLFYHSLGQTC